MKSRCVFNKVTAMFSVFCMLNSCIVSAGVNVFSADNGKMDINVLLMYNERYSEGILLSDSTLDMMVEASKTGNESENITYCVAEYNKNGR